MTEFLLASTAIRAKRSPYSVPVQLRVGEVASVGPYVDQQPKTTSSPSLFTRSLPQQEVDRTTRQPRGKPAHTHGVKPDMQVQRLNNDLVGVGWAPSVMALMGSGQRPKAGESHALKASNGRE